MERGPQGQGLEVSLDLHKVLTEEATGSRIGKPLSTQKMSLEPKSQRPWGQEQA